MKYFLERYFKKKKEFNSFVKCCSKKYHKYYINRRIVATPGNEYNYITVKILNEKIKFLIYNE